MTSAIALAAGGTGGHMFPAEALAQELKRRHYRVVLLTDARGLKYARNFPADSIVTLAAANPNVRGLMGKISAGMTMAGGVKTAISTLRDEGVRCVVGFGGYPSAPGLFAAWLNRIPFGIHEQNAVLGRVNRRGAPYARFVAHGFPRLQRLPPRHGPAHFIGNPVRDAVLAAAQMPYQIAADGGPLRLLVFGGSQGAALFSRLLPPALGSLPEDLRASLQVTHQATEADEPRVAEIYASAGITAEIAPFFDDLPARIATSDFVVCRAGASSVTELSVIGRPALLIPLAIAMDDHQRGNAAVLEAVGAADVLVEGEATSDRIAALLLPRLRDRTALIRAAAAARGQVPTNAATRLADLLAPLL